MQSAHFAVKIAFIVGGKAVHEKIFGFFAALDTKHTPGCNIFILEDFFKHQEYFMKKSNYWHKKIQSSASIMAKITDQEAVMKMVGDLEMEMMSDLYRRMTDSCQQKCINTQFREADLSKGEAVCLDRCVFKYLDVHDRLGKVLTQMTQQDDKQLQQNAHEQKHK